MNDSTHYSTHKVPPALQPFVEKIVVEQSAAENKQSITSILPTGTADLLFHFGDPFVHVNNQTSLIKPQAYIAGQRTGRADVAASGRTGIVIVNLTPWGLGGFTNIPAAIFANHFVDLGEIFPREELSTLMDRLLIATSKSARVHLVEQFLIRQLSHTEDKAMIATAKRLYGRKAVTLAKLTDTIGVSKRQFNRRFRSCIGLPPKKLETIIRVQRSLAALTPGKQNQHHPCINGVSSLRPVAREADEEGLCQTALAAGYYDQAHMNHDYQRLLATSPTQVLAQSASTPLLRFYEDRANMSRFYNRLHLQ